MFTKVEADLFSSHSIVATLEKENPPTVLPPKRRRGRPPVAERADKTLFVALTKSMHKEVLAKCAKIGLTSSAYIRKLVERDLKLVGSDAH